MQLIDCFPEGWKLIIKENYEKAINLIIHDHRLIKNSKVITSDKLTSIDIFSVLTSKIQNKHSFNIYFKICFITIILTGQQSTYYHALLHIIPIHNLFDTKS